MSPSPDTWITTDGTGDGMTVRAVVFLLILVASGITAWGVREAMRASVRRAGGATRHALTRGGDGRPWACARCRSFTPDSSPRCSKCGADRASSQLAFAPVETEPDVLPEAIPVTADALVFLEHDAAAHEDGLNGHWRLRVNGVVVGFAARRDGVLHLLRAVQGGSVVMFDPHGNGVAPYPLEALIRAFEGPRLPLGVPCPEAAKR
jgi:hypothetical protein